MKKLWLSVATAVGLCFALVGCQTNSVDLSPDGKTVAIVSERGLELRPANEAKGRLLIPGKFEEPLYAPDGRSIATFLPEKRATIVVDLESGRQTVISAPFLPPYAWNQEGTELIGWRDETHALVFHRASKGIVRTYNWRRPIEAVWLGGREMGLLYSDHVSYIHGGLSTDTSLQLPSANSLRGDTHHLIWIESQDVTEQDGPPEMHAIVRSLDLDTGDVQSLRDIPKTSALIQNDHLHIATTLALSPDGNRLAFAGLVDASAPGVLQRALDLARLAREHPNDRSLDRQAKEIEKQIVLHPVVAVTQSLSGDFASLPNPKRGAESDIFPQKLLWSRDGGTLAVVFAKAVITYTLP